MRLSFSKIKIIVFLFRNDLRLCYKCLANKIGEKDSNVAVHLNDLKKKGVIQDTDFICEGENCQSSLKAKTYALTNKGRQWGQILEKKRVIK
ncbi:MAG: hypothetical protein QXO40_00135 [Candidatus Aenigmatarchaeota archaeon]